MATPLSLASSDVTTAPTDPNAPAITTDSFSGDDLTPTARPSTSTSSNSAGATITPSDTGIYVSVKRTGLEPFSVVGASWAGDTVGDAAVRTTTNGTWSPWIDVHASRESDTPDGTSPAPARTTTDPVWAGSADGYEVVLPSGATDVQIHVVRVPKVVAPARSISGSSISSSGLPGMAAPPIISRESWQAAPPVASPSYASTVKMAFIHHTASSNNYSSDDVASLMRGFQAFHQGVNGWNDIGYNFLIDRWGRIWEGRAGGVDRAVIGAHAGGFNTTSTGISFIGEFTSATPPAAMTAAATSLIAWKLSLTGADPNSWSLLTSAGSSKFTSGTVVALRNVSGHRDVSLTACPGSVTYSLVTSIANNADRLTNAAVAWPGGTFGLDVAGGSTTGTDVFAYIPGRGAPPHLRVLNANGSMRFERYVYDPQFLGGVRIAFGDVDPTNPGDEIITTPGPGGGSHVDIWNLSGVKLRAFYANGTSYSGGQFIAAGDTDGDGDDEIVVTKDSGSPEVRIYSGTGTLVRSFLGEQPTYQSGLRVAAANLDGDASAEIVLGLGPNSPPVVHIYEPTGEYVRGFVAFSAAIKTGVDVATMRAADGSTTIAVGLDSGIGPHVGTFDRFGNPIAFFATHYSDANGVSLASMPSGTGADLLIAAPSSGGTTLRMFDAGGSLVTPVAARTPAAP